MAALIAVQLVCLVGILPLIYLDRDPAAAGAWRADDELGANLMLAAIVMLSDAAVLTGFAFLYSGLHPRVALLPPLPVAAQFALALLLGDLLSYWHHRLLHRLPWLWASHVVHHQSRRIDLSTGLRNHPFATISACLFWSPLLLLGISPAIMLLAAGVIGAWALLVHSRKARSAAALPAWAGWIFNLPAHHLMHHRRPGLAGHCNFGLLFILWDRLFGTFGSPRPSASFGVAGEPAVAGAGRLLWNQWRLLLGMGPCRRPRAAGPSRAVGLTAYLGAAILVGASLMAREL